MWLFIFPEWLWGRIQAISPPVTTKLTYRCCLSNDPAAEWLCAMEAVFTLFLAYCVVWHQDYVLVGKATGNKEDMHCG